MQHIIQLYTYSWLNFIRWCIRTACELPQKMSDLLQEQKNIKEDWNPPCNWRFAPENGWLEYDRFLSGWPIFSYRNAPPFSADFRTWREICMLLGITFDLLVEVDSRNGWYVYIYIRNILCIQCRDILESWTDLQIFLLLNVRYQKVWWLFCPVLKSRRVRAVQQEMADDAFVQWSYWLRCLLHC